MSWPHLRKGLRIYWVLHFVAGNRLWHLQLREKRNLPLRIPIRRPIEHKRRLCVWCPHLQQLLCHPALCIWMRPQQPWQLRRGRGPRRVRAGLLLPPLTDQRHGSRGVLLLPAVHVPRIHQDVAALLWRGPAHHQHRVHAVDPEPRQPDLLLRWVAGHQPQWAAALHTDRGFYDGLQRGRRSDHRLRNHAHLAQWKSIQCASPG